MLRKRLVGVVTVMNGWAVQSFGYRRHLPLGHPERLAENLDRWGADEILVLAIDRSRLGLGPDLGLLERLARLGLATPLVYGGGIGSADDAKRVVQTGADRVCFDSLLRRSADEVERASAALGAQALIAALPMTAEAEGGRWHDYLRGGDGSLSKEVCTLLGEGVVSEALVIDWRNEGGVAAFDEALLAQFPLPEIPLIAFGGISEPAQVAALLARPQVVAVAAGNSLSYREHAIQRLREGLDESTARTPHYA